MAKYNVTYKCNHEGTVELFGKSVDRERKLEWLESALCPECYAREQAQEANEGKQIEEIEMLYSEYKNNYAECKTLPNSYNRQTKTIVVLVPVEKEVEAEAEATEEATEEILTIEEIAEICNAPVSAIRKMAEMSNEKLDEMLSQYNKTMASPNPKKVAMVDQAKKSVELVKKYKAQQK